MRILYLTLGLFVLMGINSTCRTPSLTSTGCPNATLDDRCATPDG